MTGERREQHDDRRYWAQQPGLTILRPVVKKPEAQQVDCDGNGHGCAGADGADLRVVRRLIHGDGQPRPHGGRGREDQVVSVAPDDGLAQAGEEIVDRTISVKRPYRSAM